VHHGEVKHDHRAARARSKDRVSGSEEPVVNISELTTGRRVDSLKGSSICVVGAAFAPDARTLATCTVDGGMKLWHAATGKELFALGISDYVNTFLFAPAPNSEYLAVARGSEKEGNQRVELWRAPSFEEIISAEQANRGEPGTGPRTMPTR